jgi:hypothetical protein
LLVWAENRGMCADEEAKDIFTISHMTTLLMVVMMHHHDYFHVNVMPYDVLPRVSDFCQESSCEAELFPSPLQSLAQFQL